MMQLNKSPEDLPNEAKKTCVDIRNDISRPNKVNAVYLGILLV